MPNTGRRTCVHFNAQGIAAQAEQATKKIARTLQ